MNMIFMFLSFVLACVVILVCLTKKQMKIARAVFLAFGIAIGFSTALLIYAQYAVGDTPIYMQSETLRMIVSYMLAVTTISFDTITLVLVVATIILSVFAVKKIVEYLKHKHPKAFRAAKITYPLPKTADLPQRKIFVLYCRWNN